MNGWSDISTTCPEGKTPPVRVELWLWTAFYRLTELMIALNIDLKSFLQGELDTVVRCGKICMEACVQCCAYGKLSTYRAKTHMPLHTHTNAHTHKVLFSGQISRHPPPPTA